MVRIHAGNPAPLVEAAFRRIERERMADLPFCNAALCIEAVGFDLHEGQWLGVLVAPWAMSLLLVPGEAETWVSAPEGKRLMIHYPAGDLPFLGGHEDEIGEYLTCPLIPSMTQFADQETARLTAFASRIALLQPPPMPQTEPLPARRRFFLYGS